MRRDLPDRLSDALEEVIGLAVLDVTFAGSLVRDPVGTVRAQQLALTPVELRALDSQRAADLPTFTRGLINWWRSLNQVQADSIAALPRLATRQPARRALRRSAEHRP